MAIWLACFFGGVVCGALGYAAVNFWRAKREKGTLLVVRDDKGQIIGCRSLGR